MTDDPFEIPEFLRVTKESRGPNYKAEEAKRLAAWREKHGQAKPRSDKRRDWELPKTIDAAGLALRRAQDKEATERKKARLAALKEQKKCRV